MNVKVLLLLLILCCVSCQDASAPSDVLRLNLQTDPFSLDPRVGGDRRTQVVTRCLFEGLMRMGPDGRPHPALAERVDISEDGLEYRFHLRSAVWNDGTPITAHDFERSWKEALSPHFDTAFAYAYYPIRGAQAAKMSQIPVDEVCVRAEGDQTLVVELEYVAPFFLDLVCSPVYCPVRDGEVAYSGPFVLRTWNYGDRVVVERNDHYWDAAAVALQQIEFTIVSDSNTSLELFRRGKLDWAGEPLCELPTEALDGLRQKGQLETDEVAGVYRYHFNVERPPFNNAKVRRAFSMAIDREAIAEHVLRGGETPAGSLLPPSLSMLGRLEENLSARALLEEGLAELGMTRADLPKIVLSYPTLEGEKALSQAVQQQWERVLGVKVELDGSEWNVYRTNLIGRNYQIGGAVWYSWYNDPTYNLKALKSKSHAQNATQWEHPRLVELLDLADHTADAAERTEYLKEAEALVCAEMPVAPVYTATYKHISSAALDGVLITNLGAFDLKWARLTR